MAGYEEYDFRGEVFEFDGHPYLFEPKIMDEEIQELDVSYP